MRQCTVGRRDAAAACVYGQCWYSRATRLVRWQATLAGRTHHPQTDRGSEVPSANAGKKSSALPFCGCTARLSMSNRVAPPCTWIEVDGTKFRSHWRMASTIGGHQSVLVTKQHHRTWQPQASISWH